MDVSSKSAILKLILPHVPYLTVAALAHTFYLSPTSLKWDLRTELVIKLIRAILAAESPHGALHRQQVTLKDPGIQGKVWISKVELAAPGLTILDAFCQAIEDLKTDLESTYTLPAVLPVQAEWTSFRPDVPDNYPRPDLGEAQQYERLMEDTTTPVTILYFHGGAHVMMDPSSHRRPVSQLCRLTGGRALSVRYRLSPQNPFPAALLDAYIAYLSLLYPPSGAYHQPVSASNIVFAGDSAGGNVSFALVQLLLQLNRTGKHPNTVDFHENRIPFPVPLPAGVACHSPWLDLTYALPSQFENAKYDYLPKPDMTRTLSRIVPDSIWPADPPRGDLYCDTNMLCHPLVSPVAATDWRGAPAFWFACGEEMLVDEAKQLAQTAARQGVTVIWEQWQAMCHCFGMVLVSSAMSKQFFHDWAHFCKEACGVSDTPPAHLQSKGSFFEVKTLRERDIDVKHLSAIEHEDALLRMKENMETREADAASAVTSKLVPHGVAAAVQTAGLVESSSNGSKL